MVWKPVQLESIVETLKSYMSLDFVPKFTRNTVQYIGSFMGRAVRCQREIVTKRLNRRTTRKLEECKRKIKTRSSKCTCSKCTGFRYVQKKRVIEPDFLANLAYSQRVSRDHETSMDGGYNEPVGEITLSPGETWWNKVVNQRNGMPPLYRGPLERPTRSDCSSASSGFRSATPDIFSDASELSRSFTPLSASSENSCTDLGHLSYTREGSKSDSKILNREDNSSMLGPHAPTRSASTGEMARGISSKEGRSSTTPIKPKLEMKSKKKRNTSIRTTSHASDCFSTCVKCSRNLSRAI